MDNYVEAQHQFEQDEKMYAAIDAQLKDQADAYRDPKAALEMFQHFQFEDERLRVVEVVEVTDSRIETIHLYGQSKQYLQARVRCADDQMHRIRLILSTTVGEYDYETDIDWKLLFDDQIDEANQLVVDEANQMMADEEYIDMKEQVAFIIFDYDYEDPEMRPHEETCHELAEQILKELGME
jgi:hypothetical protein